MKSRPHARLIYRFHSTAAVQKRLKCEKDLLNPAEAAAQFSLITVICSLFAHRAKQQQSASCAAGVRRERRMRCGGVSLGFFCDAVDNHPAVFRRFGERLPAVTVVEAIGVNAAHASRVLLNTKPPSELSPIYICVQCQNLRVQFKLVFVENVNYLIYGRLDVELWVFVLFCWSSV